MKATLKKLIVLALALIMAIGLVACAPTPELDLEDAAENLEGEKYDVVYIDDEDYLGPGQKERLEAENDDGDEITVIRFEKASTAKAYYNKLKLSKKQDRAEIKDELKLLKHFLKNYEDDMDSDDVDELEDMIKNYEKKLKKFDEEKVIGIKGSVVWYGNESAIEDSQG